MVFELENAGGIQRAEPDVLDDEITHEPFYSKKQLHTILLLLS